MLISLFILKKRKGTAYSHPLHHKRQLSASLTLNPCWQPSYTCPGHLPASFPTCLLRTLHPPVKELTTAATSKVSESRDSPLDQDSSAASALIFYALLSHKPRLPAFREYAPPSRITCLSASPDHMLLFRDLLSQLLLLSASTRLQTSRDACPCTLCSHRIANTACRACLALRSHHLPGFIRPSISPLSPFFSRKAQLELSLAKTIYHSIKQRKKKRGKGSAFPSLNHS